MTVRYARGTKRHKLCLNHCKRALSMFRRRVPAYRVSVKRAHPKKRPCAPNAECTRHATIAFVPHCCSNAAGGLSGSEGSVRTWQPLENRMSVRALNVCKLHRASHGHRIHMSIVVGDAHAGRVSQSMCSVTRTAMSTTAWLKRSGARWEWARQRGRARGCSASGTPKSEVLTRLSTGSTIWEHACDI